MSQDEFVARMESSVKASSPELKDQFKAFCERCSYITINQDAGDESYVELRKRMEGFIEGDDVQDRHFYMSLPPKIYVDVSEQLRRHCYSERGNSNLVVGLVIAQRSRKQGLPA